MQTIFGTRLEQHASHGDARVALVLPGREVTYAELLRRARACAARLAHERLASTEIVGITIADDLAHIVASLALLLLGVPQVCLPTHDPAAKRQSLADKLAVRRVVVTDPRDAPPGLDPLSLAPEHGAAADSVAPNAITADPDGPAMYYASSGATGEAKLFALSQRALAWRAERIAESEQARPGYRSLTFVPIEDSMAKSRLLTCAYLGFTSVVPNARSLASAQEMCARHRVTCLELTILQVSSMVIDATDPRSLPSHTAAYTAGARVPLALRWKFEARFGVPLFIHYGAREFGRISSTFPGADRDDPGSVGRPVPWIDLKIVDSDGTALPPGAIGEVRVRSECMAHEYHGDPVATARHFKDGWFYPKDLACLTTDGLLRLYGRADDMMNLNGIKIFPAEIERVLEEHPAVRTAAAFSKQSAAHGDIPVAAVELHESATVAVDELMACARARLGVRAPRRIIVLDALPRNPAGKIVKRELADLLAPGK